MAIKNELDLDNKYKQLIDVEVQKNQIQTPTIQKATQMSSFSVPTIKPITQPTIKQAVNAIGKPVIDTTVQPTLKPIQQTYVPTIKPSINKISIPTQLPVTSYLNAPATIRTPEQVLDDMKFIKDSIVNVGIPSTFLGIKDIPSAGVIAKQEMKNKSVSASAWILKNVLNAFGALNDEQNKSLGVLQSKTMTGDMDFSFMTTERQKEIANRASEIMKEDSSYIAQKNQELLDKFKDKDISQFAKMGSEVSKSIVDILPVIATDTLFGKGGLAVMFGTVFSRQYGNGLNMGLNQSQSATRSTLLSGLEVFTETMFNGIPMMKQSKLGQWISSKMDNYIPQIFTEVAKDEASQIAIKKLAEQLGEGFEEVVSEIGGFFVNKLYEVEDRTGKELAIDTAKSFFLGFLTSAVMQVTYDTAMKTVESIANASTINNLSIEESKVLATKISQNVLNYDVQFITKEQAVEIAKDLKTNGEKFSQSTASIVHEYNAENNRLGTIYIIENDANTNPLMTSFFHEITHALEITKSYKELLSLVQSTMGDEFTQSAEKIAKEIYKKNKDSIYKRSGVKVGESEFVAEYIIQRLMFGQDSGMRISYIRKLAQEKPKLFERISDAINSFNQRMIRHSMMLENSNDQNYVEFLKYTENLKTIYENAVNEFSEMKPTLLEQAQALALNKKVEQKNVQLQISKQTVDAIKIEEYPLTEDKEANKLHYSNYIYGLSVKNDYENIKATFELSEQDMDVIFETLGIMDDESANDNQNLISSINNALNGKLNNWFSKITALKNYQLLSLVNYLKNTQSLLSNVKKIQDLNAEITGTKNVNDYDPDNIDEMRAKVALDKLIQINKDKAVKIIGLGEELDKDLVVLHNISEEQLKKAIQLGGFAMPSLAVTKAGYPHSKFGSITVVFNKDILNGSPTYSSDAFTPRFPTTFFAFKSKDMLDTLLEKNKKYSNIDGYEHLEQFVYYNKNSIYSNLNYTIKNISISALGTIINNQINNDNEPILSLEELTHSKESKYYDGIVDMVKYYEYSIEREMAVVEYLKSFGGQEYFRNNLDLFTPTGNRRSPEMLLNEVTLANVVKHMNSSKELVGTESGFDFDIRELKAMLSPIMNSVKDVSDNRNLIEKNNYFDSIMSEAQDSIDNVKNSIENNNPDIYDDGMPIYEKYKDVSAKFKNKRISKSTGEVIEDIVSSRKPFSVESIIDEFEKYGMFYINEVPESEDYDSLGMTNAEILYDALNNVKNLTSTYFESKPRRAVELKEIDHVILPNETSQDIINALKTLEIPHTLYEYNYNDFQANGRLPIIENNKEWQFQLVASFKNDSIDKEMTLEQQKYFYNSKVVDNENRLLLTRKWGFNGYLNITNPFDSRQRVNREAIEAYNYQNIDSISLNDNGLLNEKDAFKLLSFLNLNGFPFDGIIYESNGDIDYIPLTFNQFKPENDVNPILESEPQFQYTDLLKDMETLYYVTFYILKDYSFSNVQKMLIDTDKQSTIDELQKIKPLNGSDKKYLEALMNFVNNYDVNYEHDTQGNVVSIGQKEYFKDSSIRINGVLMPVYHATNYGEFNEFNYRYVGTTGINNGIGIYSAKQVYSTFGYTNRENQNIKELYVNVKNPIILGSEIGKHKYFVENGQMKTSYSGGYEETKTNNFISKENWDLLINDYKQISKDYIQKFKDRMTTVNSLTDNKYRADKEIYGEILDNISKSIDATEYDDIYNQYKGDAYSTKLILDNKLMDIVAVYTKFQGLTGAIKDQFINDYLKAFYKNTGYDGVVVSNVVIGFFPSQFKDTQNKNPIESNLLIEEPEVQMQLSTEKDSDGLPLTMAQQVYFIYSKVRDEFGNLLKMYHGTPNGNFNMFKGGTYFTSNIEYAKVYQNQYASSISTKKEVKEPKLYQVYLDIKKPFDTRNEAERNIFLNEYYKKYGMGTPLTEKGLPDWLDGQDLMDFIQEKGYDYDGLILDEGAVGGYGEEVVSRGISYVIFNSEQVKDVSNLNPTNNPDFQMQLPMKSSTGERLTEGQKRFFLNVAPELINGRNELKTYYHGSDYIFTVPLKDKSNGYYRFGNNNVMFFASNYKVANSYAKGKMQIIDFKSINPTGNMYKGYVNSKTPLIFDANDENWNDILVSKDNSALNSYSNEALNNYKQVYEGYKPVFINTVEEFNRQKNTIQEGFDTLKKDLNNYLKNNKLNNKANKTINTVNSFLDDIQTKINNSMLYIEGKVKNNPEISKDVLKDAYFFNHVPSLKNDMSFINKLINEDENIINDPYARNRFGILSEIIYSNFVQKSLAWYSEYFNRISMDMIVNEKAQTTNEIVEKVLELKNKNLITSDSIVIKNVYDVSMFPDYETYTKSRSNFMTDILITLEDSMFKDYQNENPTLDKDIQLQIVPTTKFIESLQTKINDLKKDYDEYMSRKALNLGNFKDHAGFIMRLNEIKNTTGKSVPFKDIKNFILNDYKNQNDDVKRNAYEYMKASSILQDEKNKLEVVNTIMRKIPYETVESSASTSSIYAQVKMSNYDYALNVLGNKVIVLTNPSSISGDTFTIRISDHDRLSETYDNPDMAVDIRDFGYVRPSESNNINDSQETDSDGNVLTIGQAKRFANSVARNKTGNLNKYYLSYPANGSPIIGYGLKFSTSKSFAESQLDSETNKQKGVSNIIYEFYLDIRTPFDTKNDDEARRIFNDLYLNRFSSSSSELKDSGLPSGEHAESLKEFLINNNYNYDAIYLDEGNGVQSLVTLKDGVAKVAENKNPSIAPTSRYVRPNESLSIQHSLFNEALTEEEKKEIINIQEMDDLFSIEGTQFEKRLNDLLEKQNKVIMFGDLVKYKTPKGQQWNNEFKKVYTRVKRKYSDMPLNKIFDNYLAFVKGYGNTQRRTVEQWTFIAKNFGMEYKPTSQMDLLEQALVAWFRLEPNQKNNLNRQGKKYVPFKAGDWINAVFEGANVGLMVSSDSVIETKVPEINELVKEEHIVTLSEDYEGNEPYYPFPEDFIPPETEQYYIPRQDELNDFYTEVYVKDVITKPVLEDDVIRTRKHPRTVIASGNVSDAVIGEVEESILNGEFNYYAVSDKSAIEYAKKAIEGNLDEQKITLIQNYENGYALTKQDIAIGELLVAEYSKAKDVKSVQEILAVIAGAGTEMGQAIQALHLINKLTGYGQLLVLEKVVKRMNSNFAKENRTVNGVPVKLTISENLKNELIQQTDKNEIQRIVEQIKLEIAKQVPSTVFEKLNSWRYLSMLGNIATHVRNVMGNLAMIPMRVTRDVMSSAIQLTLSKEQRDRNISYFFDKNLKDFARNDFETVRKEITHSGKYDLRNEIEQKKTTFDNKVLEYIMNKNFDALEYEDVIFMRSAYIASFGQYMKAKGLTPETITNKQLQEARKHAYNEAKKSTYRSASKLASLLNQFAQSSKIANISVGAVIPFAKTPINILKTGFEYSPFGLMYNIPKAFYRLAKGDTATEIIDSITAGMTGTMISALGAFMFSMGLLNVGEDDEDPYKKQVYDRSLGFQRYSINIAGGTYSLDWLAPAIIPLIMGAEFQKSLEQDYNGDSLFNYAPDILLGIFDPLFQMSMLQGIFDMTESFSQSSVGRFGEAIFTGVTNYVTQYIPTFLGQLSRTFDDYQRSTYAPKDSEINPLIEKALRQVANKIPFVASYINAPSVDIMGNKIERPSNMFSRILLNFVSPGSYKPDTATSIDKEVVRLYEATKDSDIIPDVAPKSFTMDGNEYVFDNKELAKFSEDLGTNQYNIVNQLFKNSDYNRLTMSDKVDIANDIYKYAYAIAKNNYLSTKGLELKDAWYDGIIKAQSAGIEPVEYLLLKKQFSIMESDSLTTKKEKFINYLNSTGRSLMLNKYLKYVGGYNVDEYDMLSGLK